jgi:PleD family two-component response regulator
LCEWSWFGSNRADHELDITENGKMAIEKWEQGEYGLILMDVQMPQMNSFEATREESMLTSSCRRNCDDNLVGFRMETISLRNKYF